MDDKPIILIEWTDAENGEGWLMHENEEWIVIAHHWESKTLNWRAIY